MWMKANCRNWAIFGVKMISFVKHVVVYLPSALVVTS